MKHAEGTFRGVRDANLYHQSWLPEGEPKAALLLVHGICEHCGRYTNVVNHLVPRGYAVYGLDHVGHGKSSGVRAYVNRFEEFTDTLYMYQKMIRAWQPGKPLFLFGHSLGGLIGIRYLLDYQSELRGAVLSAPSVGIPKDITPMTIQAGKLLSALLPRFGMVVLNADHISRDPEVCRAYVNDPLVYRGKITARLGVELLAATQRAQAEATWITLPLLVVQGSEDKLAPPDDVQVFYRAVRSTDKTLKVYPGLYHEVFNEPERDEVLRDIEGWLEAHLDA